MSVTPARTDPHTTRVAAIAQQVCEAASAGRAHISNGATAHVVPLPGDQRRSGVGIDTSQLQNIVSIDPETCLCVAEPGVTFERLLRATLEHGLIPTVVPELRGITIGGAVAGCSVESMSFRHGGFHDSALAYEVVTGDGRILQLSRRDHPDLFEHLHGSYGTLGILTQITFRLVPAMRYVEMDYRHFTAFDAFEEALTTACDADSAHDFVDAVVAGPDHLVLCIGTFVADTGGRTPSDYTRDRVFYRSTAELTTDLMTTEQYCFRYDAECHWLSRTLPPLEWRWVRRLIGRWVLGSTNLIAWSKRTEFITSKVLRRPDVVCDVFIPESRLGRFWDWYTREFAAWPLWVVPYRPASLYPWLGQEIRDGLAPGELFVDLAVYGARNIKKHRDLSVDLEEQVWELGGIKTLISRNHYDRDRFWRIYDRDAYVSAKSQLDPDGLFPDLYDKLGRVG